ncbi:MAG TPA: hypothetical protein VM888_01445 [Chitinophagaceae bacterium]|nr:hypothetical protein [Chitinophagaceae bacterium]
MKFLFILAFLFLISTAKAQTKKPQPDKVPQQNDALFLNPNFYPYIKKAPGTYKLRQDNMPCIVPDTKEIAAVPNAWSQTIPLYKGSMPNGGRPNVRIQYNAFKK